MRPRILHEGDPGYEEARRREERDREELWEGDKRVVLDTLLWIHAGGEDPRTAEEVEEEELEWLAASMAGDGFEGVEETIGENIPEADSPLLEEWLDRMSRLKVTLKRIFVGGPVEQWQPALVSITGTWRGGTGGAEEESDGDEDTDSADSIADTEPEVTFDVYALERQVHFSARKEFGHVALVHDEHVLVEVDRLGNGEEIVVPCHQVCENPEASERELVFKKGLKWYLEHPQKA